MQTMALLADRYLRKLVELREQARVQQQAQQQAQQQQMAARGSVHLASALGGYVSAQVCE